MDKFCIEVGMGDGTSLIVELPDEYGVLWNKNYTDLFPNETDNLYYVITELVVEKFGNKWKGWRLYGVCNN